MCWKMYSIAGGSFMAPFCACQICVESARSKHLQNCWIVAFLHSITSSQHLLFYLFIFAFFFFFVILSIPSFCCWRDAAYKDCCTVICCIKNLSQTRTRSKKLQACRSTRVILSRTRIFLIQSFILRSRPYLILDLHRSDIYQ